VDARIQSAVEMPKVAENYIRKKAIRHLEKGRVVVFASGTGNPYFSTDTAAALRALEIGADIIMKATKVDGIYDKDPAQSKSAKIIRNISHHEVLVKKLQVMDMPAITLAMENNLPVLVFNIFKNDNIVKAVKGQAVGSLIVTR